MRIVQLANLVTPTSGGLRVVVEELGAGYVAAGHDRVIVTPGPQPSEALEQDGTLRITLTGVPLPASGGYRLLLSRKALTTTLTSLRPDALEVSDRFSLAWTVPWARERGITTTLIVHERLDHALATWGRIRPAADRAAQLADRRLVRTVGEVVVPSRFAAQPFPTGRTRVVPWGVDLDRFHPRLRAPSLPRDHIRLIMVGRLSREKQPELALKTLRELLAQGVGCHLDVLGDGPQRVTLQRAARGLPVRFLGQLPQAQVAHHLAAADVALAPCPAETFGLAALEALACGTPIVVPTSGALPELLGLPAGRSALTPAGAAASPQRFAFAFAVRRLLAIDEATRREAARRRALSYPWSRAQEALLTRHTRGRSLTPAA
jgi:alpha-1,6-mannosyltransferase